MIKLRILRGGGCPGAPNIITRALASERRTQEVRVREGGVTVEAGDRDRERRGEEEGGRAREVETDGVEQRGRGRDRQRDAGEGKRLC